MEILVKGVIMKIPNGEKYFQTFKNFWSYVIKVVVFHKVVLRRIMDLNGLIQTIFQKNVRIDYIRIIISMQADGTKVAGVAAATPIFGKFTINTCHTNICEVYYFP